MFIIRCALLVLLTTVGALAANPPATVTVSPSCSSVTVNWTAAGGSGGNAPSQYEIFRDSANTQIGTVAATVLTFSDTGAGTSSHTYGVRTRASNGSLSTTTWSSSVAATCPPGAPGNLAATTPSCSQVSLSWSAPSQTGAGLVGYRIYRNNVYITQVSVLTYANSGLAASTSYTYDVSAMDSAGRESAKTRVVATTPSCQAQTPVAGPPGVARLCMEGMNGVVTWPGYTGVRYQVECSTDFGANWSPVGAPTTSFGVTNVRVGPVVVYRVAWFTNTAEYRNNYALFSSDVTPPTAASTFTATELSGARIRLDWAASSDTQSGLKGYLLYRDDAFLAYAPNGVTTYTDTTGQAVGGAYDLVSLDRAGNTTAGVKPNCTFNPPSGSYASAQSVVITAPTAGASIRYTTDGSTPTSGYGTPYSSPVYLNANTTLKAIAYKGNKTVSAVTTGSYTIAAACVAPTITSHPASQAVTAGASVSFSAAASGTATLSYQWRKNGVNVTGATSSTYSLSNVSTSDAGDYSVVVNNACGSATSFSATLTVNTPCSYSLSPGSSSFGNAGGTGSFIVYTGTTCSRTATPSSWITITSGGTGSGNGTVAFSVAANTGAARTGTITISGSGPNQTYTIYQDAAATCTYSLTPTNVYFSSAVANGSSIISAGSGCGWSVSETNAWVTITSPLSGSGGASLTYSLASNPSLVSGRVGKIYFTAGGQTKTINITQDPNYAPVANAGANSSATVGVAASLNGSGSTDEDGYIASYQWNFGDGTTGNGVTASHTYNAAGVYTVTLTATDDLGASASANKTVTVSAPADTTAPSVPGGLTASAVSSSQINLSWNASTDTGGSGLAGYKVYRSGVQIATTAATSYSHTGLSASTTHCYTVAAYDNAGNNSTQSAQTCGTTQAAADTTAPTASLTAPTSGATLSGTATFSANASDNVGVTRVEFWCDGSLLVGTDTSAPYSVTYNTAGIPNGTRTFTCKAFDVAGNVATSTAISATVNNTTTTAGQLQWLRTSLPDYIARANGVKTDSAGNVIMVGYFKPIADFGGGTMTTAGVTDAFIAKYSPQGTLLWAKRLGGIADDLAFSVAVDNANNIIVTGAFALSADFGGGLLTSSFTSTIFVAKYSPAGAHIWSTRFGPGNNPAVAVDGNGDVFVTTQSGGLIEGIQLTGQGGFDIGLVKLSGASGAILWAKLRGGTSYDYATSLAVDRNGDVVVTGTCGSGDLGGGMVSAGIFLAKYSGVDGSYKWARVMSSGAGASAFAITTDPNTANVIVTGSYTVGTDFGGGPMGTSGGIFVAAYGSSGNYLWAETFGSSTSEQGLAVAVDSNGNLALTGKVSSMVSFGGSWLVGNGNPNYFVACFTISGNSRPVYRWAKRAGGNGMSFGTGVAFDSLGNVLVAGSFQYSTEFGGSTATANFDNYNSFVAQYVK